MALSTGSRNMAVALGLVGFVGFTYIYTLRAVAGGNDIDEALKKLQREQKAAAASGKAA